MNDQRILLASVSPRRKSLLEEAGYEVVVRPSDLDDGKLTPGKVTPRQWVMSLAEFKARRVADLLDADELDLSGGHFPGVLLAADTICVHEHELLGQPRDMTEAKAMIMKMRGRTHVTITGICLMDPATRRRLLDFDEAEVMVGEIDEASIDEYLASGQWRGKAGAYNLTERMEAGWPMTCQGDPTTVMGLPMLRLPSWLKKFRNQK